MTETNEQHYLPLKIILVTVIGGLIGAVIAHLQSGMGRSDLKDLAKALKSDEYGLIVISFGEMVQKIKQLIPVENSIAHNEFETTNKKLVQKIKKALTH